MLSSTSDAFGPSEIGLEIFVAAILLYYALLAQQK